MINGIYEKPTANFILIGERTECLPLVLGILVPLSLLFFNIVLEIVAKGMNQEKEIEGIQIRKQEEPLFTENMIVNIKSPMKFI